jgi:hypothetical protein
VADAEDLGQVQRVEPGLFTGCAAGDTGAALVVRVDD